MAAHHLQALNLIADGSWNDAHNVIQDYHDELASLVHAYLHRHQGDLANASYWYGHVGQDIPENSLEEEFKRLYQLAGEND